jgi:biopolymer transport protein ExbD
MNFRKSRLDQGGSEPEINLIPFIDVLLVVLIFLMLTTTYSRYTELQVVLPVARAESLQQRPRELVVSVDAKGRYAIGRQLLAGTDAQDLQQALGEAVSKLEGTGETVLVISADEAASHQSVIRVMDVARRSGLERIVFATRQPLEAS